MFTKTINWMKGVMVKLGLVQKIKDVSDIKKIPITDKTYKEIEKWQQIYKGYFSEWHDVFYHTVASGQQKRRMASLNMAKVLSEEMAKIIFNEKCEINISDTDTSTFIHDVLQDNNFYKQFQRYLEYSFAMGGMVVKPYVDDDKIKLSYVKADSFIPISWNSQGIYEGVFTNVTVEGKKTYTLLEWHLWEDDVYVIRNELYVSENVNELGKKVLLSTLYDDLEDEVPIENARRSLFVYIYPNIANNIDLTSPLGVPIYANALDTLESLDIAFDSFKREFKLGKRRIIVPENMVNTVLDRRNNTMRRFFDENDEVYEAMGGDMDDNKIHDSTVGLRVTEHVDGINALLNLLSMQTGFSSGTFTFNGQSVKTATEVISQDSKTFRTKQTHEVVVGEALKQLVEIIIDLGEMYELFERPAGGYDVTIGFDDSIAEDAASEMNKQIQLVGAELTSKVRAIMKVHKVPEKEAIKILREIREENNRSSPEHDEIVKEVSLFGQKE
ncbi:phage portal protein [Lysinibacillus sp. NPDC086135]|uniref:phage portal protein n=1 Tax=Lysinibacillus sp. NPDC086135 TaxID=3364130 RepID=UPI00381FB112